MSTSPPDFIAVLCDRDHGQSRPLPANNACLACTVAVAAASQSTLAVKQLNLFDNDARITVDSENFGTALPPARSDGIQWHLQLSMYCTVDVAQTAIH